MKYVFSANKVEGFSESNKNLTGLLSVVFENIGWADRFGATEFYCNPGLVLDTAREYFLGSSVRCIELAEIDHGNFWPWGKFKAIASAVEGMDPDEPLVHLDLDTVIYRCLSDFFNDGSEMVVSGVEVYAPPQLQMENETIYSNLGGRDAVTVAKFYNEVLQVADGRFALHGYAYNCCILGGLSKHMKTLCAQIEKNSDLYMKTFTSNSGGMPGVTIEDWKTACVFEQAKLVDFCRDKRVCILPLSPSGWTSRNGNSRAAFHGSDDSELEFITSKVKKLGAPTHHHLVMRSSPLMRMEVEHRQMTIDGQREFANAGLITKPYGRISILPPVDFS